MTLPRLLSVAWLALFPLLTKADPAFRLFTEEYPPFNMLESSGQVGGLSTDIIRELFKRAQIRYSIESMPWIRAFNTTLLENNTCLYSTTRLEARERQFKWVGPLAENSWVLYGREDSASISSLEDVRPYKIGGVLGDAVAQVLIAKNFDVDLAASDEFNPKKLVAARIDFWATGKYAGAWWVHKEKLHHKLKPVLTFNTTFIYLACNLSTPDAIIQKLNNYLYAMRRDGFIHRISRVYFNNE